MKIFVEIDNEKCITGWGSSPFSNNCIEVEIEEDHPILLGGRLFRVDSDGIVIEDNKSSLEEHVKRKDAELSKACQDSIMSGFTHKIDGELYHFSFDLESQLNFQGAERILSQGMFKSINWTVRHNGVYKRIQITKEVMEQLAYVILIHKDSNISRYRETLMPLVYEAKSESEIEEIHWGLVFPDIDPPKEDDIGEPPVELTQP